MSFIPSGQRTTRLVPGVGLDSARIAVIGDYTHAIDSRELKPFSGPSGSILEQCLHGAGLIKAEVYLTNVFKSATTRSGKQANTDFYIEEKKSFTEKGLEHAEMLRVELNKRDFNVIVPMGNAAFAALTDLGTASKYRGYVCASSRLATTRKLVPTLSPQSTMRSYIGRHMIVADFKKAKMEAAFPEIVRPERHLIYDFNTVEEVLEYLDFYEDQPIVGFDIEVINFEVSCISFSSNPKMALVVPLGPTVQRPNGWTEDEEIQLWRGVQRVLGNPRTTKIVQNGSFDIHFLLSRCGIVVRGPVHDTMIGHSVMFPDLPKGLDFLGSIYCGSQEYWKDSVKFNNIKGES